MIKMTTMSKLWDGEPEMGPIAGEIKSTEEVRPFLEKQRKPLRDIAEILAREWDGLEGAAAGTTRPKV